MNGIKENLNKIKEDINSISKSSVQIVAASKTQTIETVKALHDVDKNIIFAENRVQELIAKYDDSYKWHFIGNLQRNKVKYIVGKVELIQSVDRESLAQRIDSIASKKCIVQDILIEVNIAAEQQKGGVALGELEKLEDYVATLKNLRHCGLMCITPYGAPTKYLEQCFEKMQQLFEKSKHRFESVHLLSTGMTDDYKIALAYGSNMIRVGRAIFGERNYV